ncbi:hypothetical protein ACFL5V_07370 [Fibrobacterota bacterium]
MKLSALLVFFLLAGRPYSQFWDFDHTYGEASYQLLKLHLSPRTGSMAGAGAAMNGSALRAADINPASASSDSGMIYLGYALPFGEFKGKIPHLTWNVPVAGYKLFVNTRFMGIDDIRGFDEDDNPTSAYGSHTFKALAGMAGIYRNIHWGLSFGYVLNSISYANYSSFVFDAGLQQQLLGGLWLGAALTNADLWGSEATNPENEDPFPPTTVRMGLAYLIKVSKSIGLAITSDARTRRDEKLNFPGGVEINWREILFFRTGYSFSEPGAAFCLGAGIRWGRFVFDYALQRHRTLSPGNYWSLGVPF